MRLGPRMRLLLLLLMVVVMMRLVGIVGGMMMIVVIVVVHVTGSALVRRVRRWIRAVGTRLIVVVVVSLVVVVRGLTSSTTTAAMVMMVMVRIEGLGSRRMVVRRLARAIGRAGILRSGRERARMMALVHVGIARHVSRLLATAVMVMTIAVVAVMLAALTRGRRRLSAGRMTVQVGERCGGG